MKPIHLILFFIAFGITACSNHRPTAEPINLTCEQQSMPLGIDTENPVFGWQLGDSTYGVFQGAYQIWVSTSIDSLTESTTNMWNSGIVLSSQSQFVVYAGKPLMPNSRYFWKVQTFDTAGNASTISKPAIFETSLLKNINWKAEFLVVPSNMKKLNSVYFRNEIKIEKKVSHARIYSTGLGAYSLFINGKRVGADRLAPGWTKFSKRLQYQVYNVDTLLKEGQNAIGAMVAKFWEGAENLTFSLQLRVEFADGTVESFVTDKTWKLAPAPVTYSRYSIGEKYNASLSQNGWSEVGFNDSNWNTVNAVNNSYNLVCQQLQGIEVEKNIIPVKVIKTDESKYVFDLGETIAGWVKINASTIKGKALKINYLSTYNFKDKKAGKLIAASEYIPNEKQSLWEPEFSYHIFRYVEVSGLATKPDSNTVIGQLAVPAINRIGQFACSNSLVNNISEAITRTGRNLLVSQLSGFPDVASRKSTGVCASAYASTAGYYFDMNKVYAKYIADLCDAQGKDGRIHFVKGDSGTYSPGWGDVMVQLPWIAYVSSGDIRILKNNYEAIKAWHEMQQRESDAMAPPYMHNKRGRGDMFALAETPSIPIGSTYYYYASNTLSKIANTIGNADDETAFMELAGFTKDQFNQSYLTYHNARYWAPTQAAHLLPLAVGLSPISHSQKIADFIASDVKKNNIHPTTGVLATQFLLPILSQNNHHNLAYKLISQTSKPSWGNMIEKGSSTIWGSWDESDESATYELTFASVGEWLYAYLVGLKLDSKQPGYKNVVFDPNPVEGLNWAECTVSTIYGKLFTRWEKHENSFTVRMSIPSNTSLTLMLPMKDESKANIKFGELDIIKDGAITTQCPAYIKFKGFDSKMAVFELGSGTYQLTSE